MIKNLENLPFADKNKRVYLVLKDFKDTGNLIVKKDELYQPMGDEKHIHKLLNNGTLTVFREASEG